LLDKDGHDSVHAEGRIREEAGLISIDTGASVTCYARHRRDGFDGRPSSWSGGMPIKMIGNRRSQKYIEEGAPSEGPWSS
jgi:hypothetical protein